MTTHLCNFCGCADDGAPGWAFYWSTLRFITVCGPDCRRRWERRHGRRLGEMPS